MKNPHHWKRLPWSPWEQIRHTNTAAIHLLNDWSCVFLVLMAAAMSALWCCLINRAAGLWWHKIQSTTWFNRISMETLVGLTECSRGLKLPLKLFWFHGRMQRDRETLMKISSSCFARAICVTRLSLESYSTPRKWFPLRVCLSINRRELFCWICDCKLDCNVRFSTFNQTWVSCCECSCSCLFFFQHQIQ